MQRTAEEIKQAHQDIADFFYPPTKYDDGYGSRPSFQGWTTNVSKFKSFHGCECNKSDCKNIAQMRIRLNIWGSLYEFDVCKKHGLDSNGESRDGNWVDTL
jgi:hypothetical protein